MDTQSVATVLKEGGIAVIPTDTLYGVAGSALRPETVERVYRVRRRDSGKPMIVLVANIHDVSSFDIELTREQRIVLENLWPGKVSIALPCVSDRLAYLHRGTGALAFRLPDDDGLRALLNETGPLVAPSANIQGEPPATTINEARAYFGDQVEAYVDDGKLASEPSTVVRLEKNGRMIILRPGAVIIPEDMSDSL